MSDEIKEILRTLKAKSTRYEYCLKENISYNDESYEAHLLLYYITNLQQENERLKDSLETMTFTAKVKQEAVDSLISRIDKAVEYIKDSGISFLNLANQRCFCNNQCADKILTILQGGKDE